MAALQAVSVCVRPLTRERAVHAVLEAGRQAVPSRRPFMLEGRDTGRTVLTVCVLSVVLGR